MHIRRMLVTTLSAMALLTPMSSPATALPAGRNATTLVVDDDRAQCSNAAFSSITEAVIAAPAGATVRVCPGLYRERVEINKGIRLIGQPDAVEVIDCFDPTWTATTALDTTALPVVERPATDVQGETPAPVLRLNADGVEVAGLAVRSLVQPRRPDSIYTAAVQADGAHSGYWIHANLIQGTAITEDRTLGIELGSLGTALSRVDHNCLRGNTWALANQRYRAQLVRIDHNDTFRSGTLAYEIGLSAARTSNVRLDHNRSVADGQFSFRIEASTKVVVDHNISKDTTNVAVGVYGGNAEVEISHNELMGGGPVGIGMAGSNVAPLVTPSTGVVLDGNTIHDYNNGIFLSNNANTSDMVITANVVHDNRVTGIHIGPTNTGALVKGNVSDSNALSGIRTAPPSATAPTVRVRGNVIVENSMHGNGTDALEATVDADGTLGNTWTDNLCVTDSPDGAICPVS
jgi:hypothetical protein